MIVPSFAYLLTSSAWHQVCKTRPLNQLDARNVRRLYPAAHNVVLNLGPRALSVVGAVGFENIMSGGFVGSVVYGEDFVGRSCQSL